MEIVFDIVAVIACVVGVTWFYAVRIPRFGNWLSRRLLRRGPDDPPAEWPPWG